MTTTLRQWLDEQEPSEETVTIKGKQFLVVELDLAERGRLIAEHSGGKEVTDRMIEGLMLSRCVLDPETREQLVPCEEWEYWMKKGSKFSTLLARVLAVNGLKEDPVEDELKNSEAIPG